MRRLARGVNKISGLASAYPRILLFPASLLRLMSDGVHVVFAEGADIKGGFPEPISRLVAQIIEIGHPGLFRAARWGRRDSKMSVIGHDRKSTELVVVLAGDSEASVFNSGEPMSVRHSQIVVDDEYQMQAMPVATLFRASGRRQIDVGIRDRESFESSGELFAAVAAVAGLSIDVGFDLGSSCVADRADCELVSETGIDFVATEFVIQPSADRFGEVGGAGLGCKAEEDSNFLGRPKVFEESNLIASECATVILKELSVGFGGEVFAVSRPAGPRVAELIRGVYVLGLVGWAQLVGHDVRGGWERLHVVLCLLSD